MKIANVSVRTHKIKIYKTFKTYPRREWGSNRARG